MKSPIFDKIKKYIQPFGRLLTILSILFIVYSVYKLGFDFDSINNWRIFIVVSVIGVIIKIFTIIISADAWCNWLKLFSLNKRLSRKETIRIYSKADIGKYLPGNVMHYIQRNLFIAKLGISQKKAALCSVIEVSQQILAAFFMSVVMGAEHLTNAINEIFGFNSYFYITAILLGIIICAALLIIFRKKITAFIESCGGALFIKTLAVTFIKHILSQWLLGFIMVILYCYMGGMVDLYTMNTIISCYVIAWVLGFVIPGSSGGIGIREFIIILLLSSVVGKETILTLSVVHRLITIAGDFLCYFITAIFFKENKEELNK